MGVGKELVRSCFLGGLIPAFPSRWSGLCVPWCQGTGVQGRERACSAIRLPSWPLMSGTPSPSRELCRGRETRAERCVLEGDSHRVSLERLDSSHRGLGFVRLRGWPSSHKADPWGITWFWNTSTLEASGGWVTKGFPSAQLWASLRTPQAP